MKFSTLLVALPLAAAVEEIPCTHVHNAKTHYDLTELAARKELTVTGGDLKWTDEIEAEYSYQFAVCRQLSSENGEVPEVCADQTEDAAPVYQCVSPLRRRAKQPQRTARRGRSLTRVAAAALRALPTADAFDHAAVPPALSRARLLSQVHRKGE